MQDIPPNNPPETVPTAKGTKKILIASVIICLALSVLTLVLGYSLGNRTNAPANNDPTIITGTPVTTSTPTTAVTSVPTGELKYISAQVPEGWTLKEYADGVLAPMSNIGEGYNGFSGLQILNPQQEVVFEMYAAQGLGGSPFCKEIPKFIDTDPEYIKAIEEYAATWDEQTEVRDLSSVTYKDYNLFGVPIRYVAEELYFGTGSYTGNEFKNFSGFNPTCDAVHNSVIINSPSTYLYWKYNPGSESTQKVNLNYQVISHAKAEDMTGLDLILSTLEEQY